MELLSIPPIFTHFAVTWSVSDCRLSETVASILIPGGRSLRPVKNRRSFYKVSGQNLPLPLDLGNRSHWMWVSDIRGKADLEVS